MPPPVRPSVRGPSVPPNNGLFHKVVLFLRARLSCLAAPIDHMLQLSCSNESSAETNAVKLENVRSSRKMPNVDFEQITCVASAQRGVSTALCDVPLGPLRHIDRRVIS